MVQKSEYEPRFNTSILEEEVLSKPITRRGFIRAAVGSMAAGVIVTGCGESVKSSEGSQDADLSVIDEDTLDATSNVGSEGESYFDPETLKWISEEEWEEKYGSTGEGVEANPTRPDAGLSVIDEDTLDVNNGVGVENESHLGLEGSEEVSEEEQRKWEEWYNSVNEPREMDLTHPADFYDDRRDPQCTRALAEGERGDLRRGFTAYVSEVSSPREYIGLWAENLDGWLNAGCTPEEVEPYLALDGDEIAQAAAEQDYLQSMHEKYDFEIYKAMTGDNSMSYAMFDIYCSAHQGVLRRYLSNARKNKNLRETAVVTVKNHEITESLRGDVDYIAMTDIQITNTVDYDPSRAVYKIDGRVGLKVSTEGSTITSSLITDSDFDITKPFKSLSKLS